MHDTPSLKQKTFRGTLWSFFERFSVQGIQFLVMILMARLLTPDDYGIVGLITVFLAVSQSLIDSGFSQALIRKLDRSETDNSTVFYFNIAIGIILYWILFFCAPLIADFFDEPILVSVTRLLSLSVLFNSLVVVQRALLTIKIDFKTQAKASLAGAVISGIVGISMAVRGFGVWSIVWQQLINLIVNTVMLWILSKWRPRLIYSWASFKDLFTFGYKLALSGIIDTLYRKIYIIVIGKVFKATDLGFYTRAYQFGDFPSSNVSGIIQRVTYPVLCTIKNDEDKLEDVYRRFLRLSAFVVFPLMIGLAVVAHPLIILVLKEKWEFSAVLLQILCFQMMWYPIHSINLNLLQVKGRSDLYLRLEIWKKCIGIVIVVITIPFGLIAMCWGGVVASYLNLIINTYYTGKLINVGFFKQMRELLPSLIYSFSMGALVWTIEHFLQGNVLQLCLGIPAGILYYLIITKITGSRDLKELLSFIKSR